VAGVIAEGGEFYHGYTYSAHPVSAAVALENLRIMEEERIIEHVREDTGPYLARKWATLTEHPLVGEAVISGMMASVALTPDKASRAAFRAGTGTAGLICRDFCFEEGLVMRHVGDRMIIAPLVMRHVGDRMIIAPPLIISRGEIDTLIERALAAFDRTQAKLEAEGLMEPA